MNKLIELNNKFHDWVDKMTEINEDKENWKRRLTFTAILVLPILIAILFNKDLLAVPSLLFVISRMMRNISYLQ